MKETLVIFTAENLEKSLAGLKTQTRRVVLPQLPDNRTLWEHSGGRIVHFSTCKTLGREQFAPYGRVGDILLQAEPYQIEAFNPITNLVSGRYLRDEARFDVVSPHVAGLVANRKRPFAVTPARFMPKDLARFRYRITDVRLEKVQDISEDDAVAEGCEAGEVTVRHLTRVYTAGSRFATLWNKINDKRGYGWDANPWVFAYSYELIEEA